MGKSDPRAGRNTGDGELSKIGRAPSFHSSLWGTRAWDKVAGRLWADGVPPQLDKEGPNLCSIRDCVLTVK